MDPVHRQPALPDTRRQHQVFLDAERGEDAAFLGAERDPQARDLARLHSDDLGALEPDRALTLAQNAHDRQQGRGLSRAIAAQKRHHLAFGHVEFDAVQNVAFAIPAIEIAHRQHGARRPARTFRLCHRVTHGRLRYRLRSPRVTWTPRHNRPRPGSRRAPEP